MADEVMVGSIGAISAALGAIGTAFYNRMQKKDEVGASSSTDALKVIGDMLQRELERVHSQQTAQSIQNMQRDERLDKCQEDHGKCQKDLGIVAYRVDQLEKEKTLARDKMTDISDKLKQPTHYNNIMLGGDVEGLEDYLIFPKSVVILNLTKAKSIDDKFLSEAKILTLSNIVQIKYNPITESGIAIRTRLEQVFKDKLIKTSEEGLLELVS